MITEKYLIEASYKIDLVEFINNFFENQISQEKDLEKRSFLLEAWYDGWGDRIQSWGSKLGDFFGNAKNSLKKAGSNFSQSYKNSKEEYTPLQLAKKAYDLLKTANLLSNIELKKALEKQIYELQHPDRQRMLGFEHSLSFKDWLVIEASLPKHYRPELVEPQIRKFEVNVGDIVEMGPEVEFQGKTTRDGSRIGRIAQVKEIRGEEVIVLDLTRAKAKKQVVPISQLHDKEELRGRRIIPKEEKQLELLGGKRLWVRLTPRQYEKFASQYRAEAMPDVIPMTDVEPSTALRRMFSQSSEPKKSEVLPMFGADKKKPGASPLGKFIKKDIFKDL